MIGITHGWVPLKKVIIAGGAAGNHTVTGIVAKAGSGHAQRGDQLLSVFEQDGTSGILTDLTSEFTISADGVINNTGGTATTGDTLIVEWSSTTATAADYGG